MRILAAVAVLLSCTAVANNIQVSNTTLTENTGTTAKVQFDITWENSWRGGGVANWDAAWVFVKYKLSNGLWQHMNPSGSGHTAPSGSTIDLGLAQPENPHDPVSNPVIGIFIRRDADGTGTFSASGVQLLWDYSAAGILAQNDIAEVKVFAVEMVYVNEGAFFLGSGGDEPAHFNVSGPSNNPYRVTSENAITTGSTAPIGQFYLWADEHIEAGTIPAAFPKGFAASYAMKYEISQQQYTDFLNTLTRPQQQAMVQSFPNYENVTHRVLNAVAHGDFFGNTVWVGVTSLPHIGPFVIHSGNGAYRACNNLTWTRLIGYLDWSGLRPMTEMEYEKLGRGPLPSYPDEFAWGSSFLNPTSTGEDGTFTLTGNGATESIVAGYSNNNRGHMNADYINDDRGPFRVGIFASHSLNGGRASSGAGYFGSMELSGNVFEGVVTIANAGGRAYTGVHGNGALTAGGHADASGWPDDESDGSAWRGGSFYQEPGMSSTQEHTISSRTWCGNTVPVVHSLGGRGVRTAP